jgi:uncharacterized protein YdiU (UPF0061 family)
MSSKYTEHEQRKEGLKEQQHTTVKSTSTPTASSAVRPSSEEQHPQALVGKITTVGVPSEPVEAIYGQFVGVHHLEPSERLERMRLAERLERQEQLTLKEADFYRTLFEDNEKELANAVIKLDDSKDKLRREMETMRDLFAENKNTFQNAMDKLENTESKLKRQADLVRDIIEKNREALDMTTKRLAQSAMKLRNESNRIKAEELKIASDVLEQKAEELEKTHVQTKTELITSGSSSSGGGQQHQVKEKEVKVTL